MPSVPRDDPCSIVRLFAVASLFTASRDLVVALCCARLRVGHGGAMSSVLESSKSLQAPLQVLLSASGARMFSGKMPCYRRRPWDVGHWVVLQGLLAGRRAGGSVQSFFGDLDHHERERL